MHIAVEATRLPHDRRGIGRYVRNVLRAMPGVRPDVRYTLHVRPDDVAAMTAQLGSMTGVAERATVAPLASLRESRADLAWHPCNWILETSAHIPMVVSILDLVPMLDPRWWKVLKRAKARRRSAHTVELAARILTISEFTAAEVTRLLGVPHTRMRVTLLAADDFETAAPAKSEVLERCGIDGPFFLAVGAPDARKNLGALFDAMARLYAAGVRVPLVVCGPGKKLARLVRGREAPWLTLAGFVSDAELAALYARTTALVFPSKYEGFGLPVLEAMSAGAPVICARASSVPEVGGDAVLYFDARDTAALATAMRRLLEEPLLRADLAARMPAQVAKFSWGQCAAETLLGFDEAIAAHAQRVG
jgi:glycosyltransferase involved in cell wall biosynthesis